jgi:hypothetical protein
VQNRKARALPIVIYNQNIRDVAPSTSVSNETEVGDLTALNVEPSRGKKEFMKETLSLDN